jgi:hypothetical protein
MLRSIFTALHWARLTGISAKKGPDTVFVELCREHDAALAASG